MLFRELEDLIEKELYQQARGLLNNLKTENSLDGKIQQKIQYYNALVANSTCNYELGYKISSNLLNNSKNFPDMTLKIKLYLLIIQASVELEFDQKALDYITKCFEILENYSEKHENVNYWKGCLQAYQALALLNLGLVQEGYSSATKSLTIFENLRLKKDIELAYLSVAISNLFLQNHDESKTYFMKSLANYKSKHQTVKYAKTLYLMGMNYGIFTGDLVGSISYLKKSLEIAINESIIHLEAICYFLLGYYYLQLNKIDKGNESLQNALFIAKENQINFVIVKVLTFKSYFNQNNVNMKNQLSEDLEKAVKIAKTHSFDNSMGFGYTVLGSINYFNGELQKAINYFKQGKLSYEKCNNINSVQYGVVVAYIGFVFQDLGDLDQALDHYELNYELASKIGFQVNVCYMLIKFAEIYRIKEQYSKALEFLKKSLSLIESSGSSLDSNTIKIMTLFGLIELICLHIPDHPVQSYFNDLELLSTSIETFKIAGYYPLANVYILKRSERLRDQIKAQEILEEAFKNNQITLFNLQVTGMLLLCELYVHEYIHSSNTSLYNDIMKTIQKIETIAKNQHNYPLLIETYIMQGKLSHLDKKIDEARIFLDNGLELCDKAQLNHLREKIVREQEKIKSESSNKKPADLEEIFNYIKEARNVLSSKREN